MPYFPADTQEATIGRVVTGSSSQNQQTRTQFSSGNPAGVTYRICIANGTIAVFISYSISNPGPALNDGSITLSSDGNEPCVTYYVPPPDTGDNMSGRKRRQSSSETQEAVIYITIVGASETESHFSIDSSYGNVMFGKTGINSHNG